MATTLNGLENQTKVITMNALGEYDNLRPQVKPVEATHAQMVTMRDQGKLIPGQLYRITDYVTTTIQNGTRSAGHPFDIIVMALDATTLSENAWAIQHDGDEYFANSNLAAWKLRYNLDNIQWSMVKGEFIVPDYSSLKFTPKGTIEIDGTVYYLWYNEDDTLAEDDYGMTAGYLATDTATPAIDDTVYFVDIDERTIFDDDYHVSIYGSYEEDGKGTILWMCDEFGNECGYDFKNIQFQVYKVTHPTAGSLGYISTTESPLSPFVVDSEDFIWAYTFSSENISDNYDMSLAIVNGYVAKENKIGGGLSFNVFFEDATSNRINGTRNCFRDNADSNNINAIDNSIINRMRNVNAISIIQSHLEYFYTNWVDRIEETSISDSRNNRFIGDVESCVLEKINDSIICGLRNKTITRTTIGNTLRIICYDSNLQVKDFYIGDLVQ